MKRQLKYIAFITAILLVMASCVGISGNKYGPGGGAMALPGGNVYSSSDPLPLAPELVKSVLPNGLTYYVRYNGNPSGRAVMFLLVNSGSSNERNDQLGYAHFVEHMAFNGTKSFPENELVNYLRSIGMDFGAEINAHTSREETLFILQMPLSDPAYFDTGLKVLKEWAGYVTFDPTEVEKEKGVILEEMRLGLGPDGDARVRETAGLLAGSAHEKREPIGTVESVQNSSAEKLKAFYNEHYRPDRMAVIVVGDINPEKVAKKIEKEFIELPWDGSIHSRPYFPVEPTKNMGFIASFDPGFERSVINYRKIVPYEPEVAIGDYERLLKLRFASEAIRLRLDNLGRSGEMPWREAYFDDDYFFGSTRLYSFTLTAASGQELAAFARLSEEVERIRRYGFTESEFKRIIDLYRRWLATLNEESDELKSISFAEEYVRNYRYGEPVPGVANESIYIRKTLDNMSLAELNKMAGVILAADEGFVSVRAKTGSNNVQITEEAFEELLRAARKTELSVLPDNTDQAGLFDGMPEAGSLVREEKLNDGITELILSNGARVLLKPTNYDKGAVSFGAWSPGGYYSLPVEDQTTLNFAPILLGSAGLGSMSAIRLEEETAPIQASVQWGIGESGDYIVGKSASKDLNSLLRLVYLSSAEPGRDARAFNATKDRLADQLGDVIKDPQYRFEKAWSMNLYGDNPRNTPVSPGSIKNIDFDKTRELVMGRLASPANFTYALVGDFELETAKQLVLKHIGAIPEPETKKSGDIIYPLSVRSGGGRIDYPYSREQRASVRLLWAGNAKWSPDREAALENFAQAFNNRLLDALREDLGGTYVVSVKSSFSKNLLEQYSLLVQFDCDPARVDELIAEVRSEAVIAASGGMDPKYAAQVAVAADRAFRGQSKTNDFWVNRMLNAVSNKLDMDILGRARAAADQSKPELFKAIALELLTDDKCFIYTMIPE
ncbi:insulinase family protein [Spirochaetota bacterium]